MHQAFPLLLIVCSLFTYQAVDWLRDRYFFLWGKPLSPVSLWGRSFDRLRLDSKAPSFIKYFVYEPLYNLQKPSESPDDFLWQVKKFFSRCFPRNSFPGTIAEKISDVVTYFWYLTDNGKNIPLVSVSLYPMRVKNEVWINVFNGCVSGLLRGLGYGPYYFVRTVTEFAKERYVEGKNDEESKVSYDDLYFSYSVQLNHNPYALHTCATYVSSGILRYLYIGELPEHTAAVSHTLKTMKSQKETFDLNRLIELAKGSDEKWLEALVLENSNEFYRDICMVGEMGIMLSPSHKFNPCTKAEGYQVCRKLINFMDQFKRNSE